MTTLMLTVNLHKGPSKPLPDDKIPKYESTSMKDIAINVLAVGGVLGSFACGPLVLLALPKVCKEAPGVYKTVRNYIRGTSEERSPLAVQLLTPPTTSLSTERVQPLNQDPLAMEMEERV